MTADVEEGADLLAGPHDENRDVAGLRRELVAVLGDHAAVTDVLPGRAEDALLLAPEHVGIRVPAPGQGLHQRRSCSRTSQSARNGSTIRYSPPPPPRDELLLHHGFERGLQRRLRWQVEALRVELGVRGARRLGGKSEHHESLRGRCVIPDLAEVAVFGAQSLPEGILHVHQMREAAFRHQLPDEVRQLLRAVRVPERGLEEPVQGLVADAPIRRLEPLADEAAEFGRVDQPDLDPFALRQNGSFSSSKIRSSR